MFAVLYLRIQLHKSISRTVSVCICICICLAILRKCIDFPLKWALDLTLLLPQALPLPMSLSTSHFK